MSSAVDIDDCGPINPCLNEGVCTDRGTNDFSCDCLEGFRGVQCESGASSRTRNLGFDLLVERETQLETSFNGVTYECECGCVRVMSM